MKQYFLAYALLSIQFCFGDFPASDIWPEMFDEWIDDNREQRIATTRKLLHRTTRHRKVKKKKQKSSESPTNLLDNLPNMDKR